MLQSIALPLSYRGRIFLLENILLIQVPVLYRKIEYIQYEGRGGEISGFGGLFGY